MLETITLFLVLGCAALGAIAVVLITVHLVGCFCAWLVSKPAAAQEGAHDLHLYTPCADVPAAMPRLYAAIPKADPWQWLVTGFPLAFDDAWHDEDYFAMKRLLERADHALFTAWIAATGHEEERREL